MTVAWRRRARYEVGRKDVKYIQNFGRQNLTGKERIWEITGCQSARALYRVVSVPLSELPVTTTMLTDIRKDTFCRLARDIPVYSL